MNKKYKLTNEAIVVNGKTVYRIEALKNFGNIKRGDKGGFVESEKNLAHKGNAWVFDNAVVYNDARVRNNDEIRGNRIVRDSIHISAKVWVGDGVNSPFRLERITVSKYLD